MRSTTVHQLSGWVDSTCPLASCEWQNFVDFGSPWQQLWSPWRDCYLLFLVALASYACVSWVVGAGCRTRRADFGYFSNISAWLVLASTAGCKAELVLEAEEFLEAAESHNRRRWPNRWGLAHFDSEQSSGFQDEVSSFRSPKPWSLLIS